MTKVLNAPPKPFAWSYSAVDNFHTCPKKYYHQNIAKDVTDDSTYRSEGGKVHDILRDAVRGRALPDHLAHWRRWIDELRQDNVSPRAEVKMAFTEKAIPCEYFDKRVVPWCRLNIDVLKLYPKRALVWDWKTGKVRPDNDQLMLYALGIFLHYPSIELCDAGLIFLREDQGPHIPRNNCTYELQINRADADDWWHRYIHKVRALEQAIKTNNFLPCPSGLCKNHCPVVACEYNGHHP